MSTLEALRREKGLTLTDLEKLTGITRQALGMLEKGERSPLLETARKIADALHVTVDDLWPMLDRLTEPERV